MQMVKSVIFCFVALSLVSLAGCLECPPEQDAGVEPDGDAPTDDGGLPDDGGCTAFAGEYLILFDGLQVSASTCAAGIPESVLLGAGVAITVEEGQPCGDFEQSIGLLDDLHDCNGTATVTVNIDADGLVSSSVAFEYGCGSEEHCAATLVEAPVTEESGTLTP